LRKSVIAGNWKMHMTCAEAKSYLEKFIPLIKNINQCINSLIIFYIWKQKILVY